VFQVSYFGSNDLVFSAVLLGGGVLALALLTVIGRGVLRAESIRPDSASLVIFRRFVVGAIAFTAFSVIWFASHLHRAHELIRALRNGQCETVEGTVRVLHQEPRGGHDGSDVIRIGEKQFTLTY